MAGKTTSVPVLAPDGKVYDIPASDVAEALRRGGNVVHPVEAPDGRHYWIPTHDLEEAQRRGGHLLKDDGSRYAEGTEPQIVGRNAAGQPMWGDKPAEKPGFLKSAGDAMTGALRGAAQFLDPRPTEEEKARGLTTPYDTLMRYPERLVEPNVEMAAQVDKDVAQGDYGQAAAHAAGAILPSVGPWAAQTMDKAGGQAGEGDWSGAAGTLAGNALAAEATELAPRLAGAAYKAGKGRLAELQAPAAKLNEPIAPGELSPKERWEAANDMGVNLDRAQATNATIPKIAKRVTEHSLPGSGIFDENAANNVEALHAHAKKILNDASPTGMSREEFGNQVSEALEQHRNELRDKEDEIYSGLDKRLGDKKPDISSVSEVAKGIYDANKDMFEHRGDLFSAGDRKVFNIVKSFAEGNVPEAKTVTSPVLDARGNKITTTVQPKGYEDSWSNLQKVRSQLLDLSRGPEFVGNEATGWVKQLTGAVDDTMTNAESTPGLSAGDVNSRRVAA